MRAQPIADPGSHRGTANEHFAAGEVNNSFGMIVVDADQGPHQADVVGHFGQVRETLGHIHATFAKLAKLERTRHQLVVFAPRLQWVDFHLVDLVVTALEFWLGIKRVHLAGSAVEEDHDYIIGSTPGVDALAGLDIPG